MTEQDQFSNNEYNPIAEHELLRKKALELNLSKETTRRLLLGQVAAAMYGDDENAYTTVINNPSGFSPELASLAKEKILKRLKWESGLKWDNGDTFLPSRLKRSVDIAIANIEKLDFSTEAEFKIGRNEWLYNVQDFFEDRVSPDSKEMLEASTYYKVTTLSGSDIKE